MKLLQALADGSVVAKRNLIKIKRVPDLLVFATAAPIMFVLLFAYVVGGSIEITGSGLAEDITKDIINRFRWSATRPTI